MTTSNPYTDIVTKHVENQRASNPDVSAYELSVNCCINDAVVDELQQLVEAWNSRNKTVPATCHVYNTHTKITGHVVWTSRTLVFEFYVAMNGNIRMSCYFNHSPSSKLIERHLVTRNNRTDFLEHVEQQVRRAIQTTIRNIDSVLPPFDPQYHPGHEPPN